MAAPPRLITLNIGSQTIGLAEFRVVHGRLTLVNYRFRETPLDPETGQRRDAQAALSSPPSENGDAAPHEEKVLKAKAARAELEAVRKQVARLKVEFSAGKRY